MNTPENHPAPDDRTIKETKTITNAHAVKDLFGLLLDAQERGDEFVTREVLSVAPAEIRVAAQALYDAHKRAQGMLLDESNEGEHNTALFDSVLPVAPPKIDGYEVGSELGRGGFGVVFGAQQLVPVKRRVAIKVLRMELATRETIARFKAESGLLARMNHESIASVFDAGVDQLGRPFVSMEFIDGVPIDRACNELKLSLRDRIVLMIRVCDAVHHAHQRAVIHRDLKPANVIVESTPNGPRPRVIDFGIAKLLDDQSPTTITREHVRLGTPRYMSPEQRDGSEETDTRADVYALGAMLCEILTGDVPHPIEKQGESRARTQKPTSRTTRPSEIAATASEPAYSTRSREIRGDLDRIILKATAEDIVLRYNSASAFADDLRRYLDGLTISATPPGVVYVTRKFIRRHRASASIACVSLLALVAAVWIAMSGWREASRQRDVAISSAQRVSFIGEFLLNTLLLNADSDVRGAPPTMTKEDLQSIADRATEGLEQDPHNMLALLEGIGRIQAHYDDAPAGAATLTTALDFAIREYGVPSEEVIGLRIRLHDLLRGHGLEGSKEQVQIAMKEADLLYQPDDLQRLRVVQRVEKSAAILEHIVSIYESTTGVEPNDLYDALFSLSMLYRFENQAQQQIETTHKLYETASQYFGPMNSATINALGLYGEALSIHQPSDRAIAVLSDALERSVEVLGNEHFSSEAIRRALGRLYGRLSRADEGITIAQEDLRITIKAHGEGSIQHANSLHELGVLYALNGNYEDSKACLVRVLSLRRSQWSEGHDLISTTEIELAKVLLKLGELEQASMLAQSALEHMTPTRMGKTIVEAVRIRCAVLRSQVRQDLVDALLEDTTMRLQNAGVAQPVLDALGSI